MSKKKIGLVLAGGGAKGAYQIGIYKAMLDCKIKIDGVTGTSIGSFNAAMIAAGDFDKLEDFWLNEPIGSLLGFEDEMNFENTNIINTMKEFKIAVDSIIKQNGLPIDALHKRVDDVLDQDKLRASKLDFGLVTYRVKDKKILYLFKEDIPEQKIDDYIVASCYLPVFKFKKLDEDSYYLDGGFINNLPFEMLLEKGYKKIYVIDLFSLGLPITKQKDIEIIKIKPSRFLGGMLNSNQYRIKQNIEIGYYDGIKVFKNLDGNKFIFNKINDKIYNILIKKVSDRTLSRARVYFFTKNNKDLILKSIEYVLMKENKEYTHIYDSLKEIRRIKKIAKEKKDLIAYKFISELGLF